MSLFARVMTLPLYFRQRREAVGRAAFTKDDFVAATAHTPAGKMAATVLWEMLLSFVVCDGFFPHPGDDLSIIYGLAEEDLDEDIIIDLLNKTGSPIPSDEMLERFGPVRTPADIIKLIETASSAG